MDKSSESVKNENFNLQQFDNYAPIDDARSRKALLCSVYQNPELFCSGQELPWELLPS